jgi:hypothetical protein
VSASSSGADVRVIGIEFVGFAFSWYLPAIASLRLAYRVWKLKYLPICILSDKLINNNNSFLSLTSIRESKAQQNREMALACLLLWRGACLSYGGK